MKRILSLILLLPALALGAANDIVLSQRNADNTGLAPARLASVPLNGANGILGYVGATQLPTFWTLGPGLSVQNGALTASAPPASVSWPAITDKPAAYPSTVPLVSGLQAQLDGKLSAPTGNASQYLRGDGTLASFPSIPAAQVRADWNATTGVAVIDNKPALAAVATAGTYASLTGIPTTFAPAAHTQSWSTITSTPTTLAGYGIQDGVSQSALSGYATTGALSSGLATKFNTPAGTQAQYVRGDGSLATLPVARRIETYTGTTNAAGQVVVTYSTAYTLAPSVQTPPPASANQVWTLVSSTATGFTAQLSQRNTVQLLGAEVLLGATVAVPNVSAIFMVVSQ